MGYKFNTRKNESIWYMQDLENSECAFWTGTVLRRSLSAEAWVEDTVYRGWTEYFVQILHLAIQWSWHSDVIEHQRKKYLLIWAKNVDSTQPAHPRSLIRVFVVPMKQNRQPWLSKICLVKILIRLRACAGWSESSLDAYVRRYVFWRRRWIKYIWLQNTKDALML